MKQTHGTQLRHLIELLDGAVSAAYEEAGIAWRPRYTPVVRALMEREPLTIGQIAEVAGITQPAATQTIALMTREGLVAMEPGATDGRQKMVQLTAQARSLLPELVRCWKATAMASQSLEKDLEYPLSQTLAGAISALERKPMVSRIQQARAELAQTPPPISGTPSEAELMDTASLSD